MSERLHCLLVGLRPSDLIEIADTARALAGAGHRATLLYLYAGTEVETHGSAFELIRRLSQSPQDGLTAIAFDMLAIHRGAFESAQPVRAVIEHYASHAVEPSEADLPVSPGLLPKVWRRITDPVGTARVLRDVLPALFSLAPRIPPRLWSSAFTVARKAQGAILVYRRFQAFFTRAIAEFAFDAAIIPEDIVGPVWPVLVTSAHRAGIPVLVCPYTLANQSEAIQSLRSQPAFQTAANTIAAYLHPEWRYQDDGIDIVRLPSEHILAHHALGITPPDPWMMNSGASDKILVDSEASFEYFKAGGIPSGQMAVTGSVSLDRMHELRQNRATQLAAVRAECGLNGDKPLLLVSGCPDQLSGMVPYCEFSTMRELARFVGEGLSPLSSHYHLVVRPHPNFTGFAAMLEPFGVAATSAPTASLVPLADLFVAFASATIRWAMACGVATVNYDVFHYGYGDFAAARGVVSVSAGTDFRSLVASLTPSSPALRTLAEGARGDSARWGRMDGKGLERIQAELQEARTRRSNLHKESHPHA